VCGAVCPFEFALEYGLAKPLSQLRGIGGSIQNLELQKGGTEMPRSAFSQALAHTNSHGAVFRLKAGVGCGLSVEFGAPRWRTVVGREISDRIRN